MITVPNNTDIHQPARYAQVKVSIDPQIAAAFKSACAASNVSMAAELSKFMADYSNSQAKHKAAPDYTTRRQRRSAVKAIMKQLSAMKAREEASRDNTPVNFQDCEAYETTEDVISSLEEAIEVLKYIY